MCRLLRVSRIRIAAVDEVEEGKTLKFSFKRMERPMEGFVGRFNGTLFAYENTCRHIPISLDYGDNRFFTNQGDALMCQTHGAVYEPTRGSARAGHVREQVCSP